MGVWVCVCNLLASKGNCGVGRYEFRLIDGINNEVDCFWHSVSSMDECMSVCGS